MSVGHLLNREVEIWRTDRVSDGAGGWITSRIFSHTQSARISRASVTERSFSRSEVGDMQGAAELTHIMYFDDDADVRRGDRIRDPLDLLADKTTSGETSTNFDEYRVIGVQRATNPDVYIRAETELVQPEITLPEGS